MLNALAENAEIAENYDAGRKMAGAVAGGDGLYRHEPPEPLEVRRGGAGNPKLAEASAEAAQRRRPAPRARGAPAHAAGPLRAVSAQKSISVTKKGRLAKC